MGNVQPVTFRPLTIPQSEQHFTPIRSLFVIGTQALRGRIKFLAWKPFQSEDQRFHRERYHFRVIMLTMALIGCLPDNVQQAIKSFSIRPSKQHITFAFPFMEETLRTFCDADDDPSVLFFDECLEVVHGFQTYVTILPQLNKPCARSSLPVVLLTLYQRDTTEGICRHFQCLTRTLVQHRASEQYWKLPTMVADLSGKYKEMIVDICAETIHEIQTENLNHSFPGKNPEQLIQLIKDKFLRPCIVSYPEFLRKNSQEVIRNLTSTDPSYFLSLIELLQSSACSVLDYKKVDMMFKNPGIDLAIRDMWRIWGHDQISRKVFPIARTAASSMTKLGPLYGHLPRITDTGPDAMVSVGTLSHVPVKEGLQSVIKCLKSQDISQIKLKGSEHDSKFHSCSCSVCKIQPLPRRNSRLKMYGDFATQPLSPTDCSAFHYPFQKRPSEELCGRSTFRLQSSVSSFSYRHHFSMPADVRTQEYQQTYEMTESQTSSSAHVVHPVPHYLPINLKAFSQRMLYGYPSIISPSKQSL